MRCKILLLLLPICCVCCASGHKNTKTETVLLPGFSLVEPFNEQVATFPFYPDMRLHINAPGRFNAGKPVALVLYALANGNTIEQTAGKKMQAGDDWHYDIQHIAAQTRFLRQQIDDYNLVMVYLESKEKSWPLWSKNHPNGGQIIVYLTAYLKSCFRSYQPFLVLTGHSGAGRLIFSYLDAVGQIPDDVQRICFLDSNYGYEDQYGDKLISWLERSPQHHLCVIAYNDSVALYNGKPVVSATGGTWYRSRRMQQYFARPFSFKTTENDSFISHEALNGRVRIILKKNPQLKILHTTLVERNGFIHSMLTGTRHENVAYQFYDARAYDNFIQEQEFSAPHLQIPLRSPTAKTGSQFITEIKDMTFQQREEAILKELYTGNLPWFLRRYRELQATFQSADGRSHSVRYRVMPDYLAIGSDDNFCRMPMGPITAQKVADFYHAGLPTAKLVDHIFKNAEVKLTPVTYTPFGNQNELVEKFAEHQNAIEMQLVGKRGLLVAGIKKDVVLSNRIIDPQRPHHVTIYG